MKNLLNAAFLVVSLLIVAIPEARAQQAYSPYPQMPAYQVVPQVYQQPQQAYYQQMPAQPVYQQPINMMPPMQAQQPMMQYQAPRSRPNPQQYNNFDASTSNTVSPYDQQELALKESKMLQELENIKNTRDTGSYRQMDASTPDDDYSAQATDGFISRGHSGRVRGAVSGFGNFLKRSAQIAGPAATQLGAGVGTFFIMRAAYQ